MLCILSLSLASWNPFDFLHSSNQVQDSWTDSGTQSISENSATSNSNAPQDHQHDDIWNQVQGLGGAFSQSGGNTGGMGVADLLGSMAGGSESDGKFLGMAQQLYALYQTNPAMIGGALQTFINNWQTKTRR